MEEGAAAEACESVPAGSVGEVDGRGARPARRHWRQTAVLQVGRQRSSISR